MSARTAVIVTAVIGVAVLIAGLGALALSVLPAVVAVIDAALSPGLGLRAAAQLAAVVSFVVLIVLTVVAGDGLLGEIQFVIPGFFLFFLFFWVMAAWTL